jgi:hypothetical protein
MRPASPSALFDYLRDLAERHQDIITAVVALPEQYTPPGAEGYPLVLVEPDPFVEELNEGADLYRVAFWVNVRQARTDGTADPALVTQAKRLCDELLQQLLREQKVSRQGPATYTLHYTTVDNGLASGVRCELALVLEKQVNRSTNPNKFTPLV